MLGSILGSTNRRSIRELVGDRGQYGLPDLTTLPGIMIATSMVWFFFAFLFALWMPMGQFLGVGEESYYIALTAHGSIMVFPGLFQLMVGLSLLRSGGCLGKPVRGKLAIATYAFLNVGAVVYGIAILMGARWSYALMFPLPAAGVQVGLWSMTALKIGILGILMVLFAVIVLYPAQLIRHLFFGDSHDELLLEPRDLLDPGMLGMTLAIFLLVPMGIPILVSATAIEGGLLGIISMASIPYFLEAINVQYFFWMFAHNLMEAMGIMAISAVYAILPLYTADGSKKLYSNRIANLALIILAVSAVTAFFHHTYTTSPVQPAALSYHGNVVSWLTGIGGALTAFTVLATIWEHGVKPEPGALAILTGFGLYIVDGGAAVILANIGWNFKLHGTMFAAAHTMTILVAITTIWIGMLYHYYPVLSNRSLGRRLGYAHVGMTGVGALGLFYSFVLSGAEGIPRKVYPWPDEALGYAGSILLFGTIFFVAQLLFFWNMRRSRDIR